MEVYAIAAIPARQTVEFPAVRICKCPAGAWPIKLLVAYFIFGIARILAKHHQGGYSRMRKLRKASDDYGVFARLAGDG
jgi:hypothetical protein